MKRDETETHSWRSYTYFRWLKAMLDVYRKKGRKGKAFIAETCLMCDRPLEFVGLEECREGFASGEVSCSHCDYRIVFTSESVH